MISGDLWAGAEVVVCSLLEKIRLCKNIHLDVVILNEGHLAESLRRYGINITVFDEKRCSFISIIRGIKTLIKAEAPDVIHSHRYKENILAYLSSGGSKKTKLITTQHGLPEILGKKSNLKPKLLAKLNFFLLKASFDKVVCVSNDIQDIFLKRFHFNPRRLAAIHNGIIVPDANRKSPKSEFFCIGSAGRLFPVKDFRLFIEVAKIIADSQKNVHFLLAGDGPEMKNLQSLVSYYHLTEFFQLLGHLDNMAEFYCNIDLFVNSSIHEGIPISVLEAMAYRVPIVAPKNGGFCEIIENGRQGFLIENRDPQDFATACLKIIRNQELHQQMTEAARERVIASFSIDAMVEKYHRLYLELALSSKQRCKTAELPVFRK